MVQIARDLLGKVLVSDVGGSYASGVIVETEAYAGVTDKASHAFGDRHTRRTSVMYQSGGHAYIYLCYGIHSLFNIVTNRKGVPHAVLIRGIRPLEGLDVMLQRSGKPKPDKLFGIGPGKVAKILGLHYSMSGMLLIPRKGGEDAVWVEDRGISFANRRVEVTPRIGVGYAGPDAKLPYRFMVKP